MTAGEQTYLRIGGGVFPVYGDTMRGFSPLAQDFRGAGSRAPYVYTSVEEIFFALVNLWATVSVHES
jgi:hypothetical protein